MPDETHSVLRTDIMFAEDRTYTRMALDAEVLRNSMHCYASTTTAILLLMLLAIVVSTTTAVYGACICQYLIVQEGNVETVRNVPQQLCQKPLV
eukprot:6937-Heterococcus_DN1.PRE.7